MSTTIDIFPPFVNKFLRGLWNGEGLRQIGYLFQCPHMIRYLRCKPHYFKLTHYQKKAPGSKTPGPMLP